VVDEIHVLAASKRGADLAVSLERLQQHAEQSLQRIGLSATVAPLEEAARFLVGTGRSCTLAQVGETTPLELSIFPLHDGRRFFWQLLQRLGPELARNRSTLIFCNTRSLAERLSWRLRQKFPAWSEQIAVHHSSLSAVRRRRVEQDFKRGKLRAVVCSTSLELGIDIGCVDLVVLIHPPGGVVRLLQRVGRGGHGPGRTRRGLVITGSTAELLDAAVTATSGRASQCEPLRVARFPLDVLCQQLLGLACSGVWSADEAYRLICRAHPFANLPRKDFDDCLDYLSGGQAGIEDSASWLPSRLRWDEGHFTIRDEQTARLVRQNLGTITAPETMGVYLDTPPPRLVGEIDELFAERLLPGDRFLLDSRCLEVRRLDRGAGPWGNPGLMVTEVPGRPRIPRWAGEGLPLSAELARRLFLLRVQAADALREGKAALEKLLAEDYGLRNAGLEELAEFFERQEAVSEIPDLLTLLIEVVPTERGAWYYLHTPLNRQGNEVLARVASWRLMRLRSGRPLVFVTADLGFALVSRDIADLGPEDFRDLLTLEQLEADLEESLADGQLLRDRFARVAQTALMVLRNTGTSRGRVGGTRWSQRRLYDQVRQEHPDFVLLRQASRETADEVVDLRQARAYLELLPALTVRLRTMRQPGPFVQAWTQPLAGVAEPLETPEQALRRLHATLLGASV
jgi:ATP-dependent Lhr-like helicase